MQTAKTTCWPDQTTHLKENHEHRAPRRVVFDDSELRVIFQPGPTKHLLITFGDLVNLANGDRFYADSVIEKYPTATLGFMAKRPNWYPPESMSSASRAISNILDNKDPKILYGGSMGGFAAIKFSNLLHADFVIAHCPQFTISHDASSNWTPSYAKYLEQSPGHEAIKRGDMSGKIYIVYDPNHTEDRTHTTKIITTNHTITPLIMQGVGHHVTSALAGATTLMEKIQAVLDQDIPRLKQIIRRKRRQSEHWARSLANRLRMLCISLPRPCLANA